MCEVQKGMTELDLKIENRFDSLDKKICDFIESADSKYAEKKVEKIVYGMVALTLTTVFLALLAVVVAKG